MKASALFRGQWPWPITALVGLGALGGLVTLGGAIAHLDCACVGRRHVGGVCHPG